MTNTATVPSELNWSRLYRIGGMAPLATLTIYISQILIIIASGVAYPTTPESWFALFQRNTLLGLIFLNAFDVFSIAILGLMFLALYIALRDTRPTYMVAATFFAFLGVAVFVTTRAFMVSATLNLSNQYSIAVTSIEKSQLMTAWVAITSPARATPETIGFLFIALASFIISIVMFHEESFPKTIAYLGALGGVVTLVNDVSVVMAPSLASKLMPLNGLVWLLWWILVGRRLLQLGKEI